MGGLGFSHPTEGDKGGEEVQQALMDTWTPPPAVHYSFYYYLLMHLLVPSCRLEMGWAPRGHWCEELLEPWPPAPPASPKQGSPL